MLNQYNVYYLQLQPSRFCNALFLCRFHISEECRQPKLEMSIPMLCASCESVVYNHRRTWNNLTTSQTIKFLWCYENIVLLRKNKYEWKYILIIVPTTVRLTTKVKCVYIWKRRQNSTFRRGCMWLFHNHRWRNFKKIQSRRN